MTDSVRWGILGCGGIAAVFAQDVGLLEDAEVAAVASRRPGVAKAFAATYGAGQAYDSYAELLADPAIDLVYVAVPHSEHLAVGLEAIRAGKHVLIEKPFTLNASEAEQLIAEAGDRGVFLMEAMWTRLLPHMIEAHRLVEDGLIGEVVYVLSDHGLRFDPAHPEHRLYDPALGGGALLDLGVYAVSFVVSFLGDDLEIKALATKTATGVDAELSAIILDERGRHGVVVTSLSTSGSNRAMISGTRGRIEIGHNFMGNSDLDVYLNGPDHWAPPYDFGEKRWTFYGGTEGQGSGHQVAPIEAARCVREGLLESPMMPLSLTVKVMRVMDEMRRQGGIQYAADEAVRV